jgi:adenylate cyclase class 2
MLHVVSSCQSHNLSSMTALPTEIEAKFFCNKTVLKERLSELGATLVKSECMMRRKHFDTPERRLHQIGGWIRLRDEGDKITLAYKQLESHSLGDMKEVEIIVDNFQRCEIFLASTGFVFTSYQENQRESWLLNGVKIDIDTCPWLPPLVEVECLDEKKLWAVVAALGLHQDAAFFGGIEIAYMKHFHITQEQYFTLDTIAFGPAPDILSTS